MPVLITATLPVGNPDEARRWAAMLEEKQRTAPGFLFHGDGPVDGGGWRIVEAWESRAAYEKWFETQVKPRLEPGQEVPPDVVELLHAFGN